MSAFLVSKKHIDCLVHARSFASSGHNRHFRLSPELTDDALGRLLWRENMASTMARYPKEKDMAVNEALLAGYSHRVGYDASRYTIAEMLKAIHCYVYQACEHEGWKTSASAKFCRDLEKQLVTRLPGYDEAPWGID